MNTVELQQVIDRLDRLEKQNRWLKRVVCAVVLVAGVGLVMGADDKDVTTLRDSNGKQRAGFLMTPAGPTLRFYDANGKGRGDVVLGQGALAVRYLDAGGRLQSGVGVQNFGVSIVSYNDQGKIQTGVDAIREDSGLLSR